MKKIKRIIALFLSLICLSAPANGASFALDGEPVLSARSAILIRQDDKRVLFEKNADQPLPMASTTKIMTALIVLENLPLEKVVCTDKRAVGIEGSSMYLEEGEKVCVKDLIYALMLQSANDAAAALAIETAGGIEAFACLMNAKAEELGLENTHFTNPHGLDDDEHYTTARELAMITAAAFENKIFRDIVSSVKYCYKTDRKSGVFVNHNKLLFTLDNCVGVKTGYTRRSGRSLVSATDNNGLVLIAVTIDAPSDWQDHKLLHSFGSSLFSYEKNIDDEEFTYTVPVINGTKERVICGNTEALDLWIEKNSGIRYEIELPDFVYAPVNIGDRIGRIVAYSDGREIASCDITACEVSENTEYKNLLDRITDFFRDIYL